MSAINLAGTMDALAAKIPDATTYRAFAYPPDNMSVPSAVVGYPTALEFDMTFGRGSDRAVFPVWFVVGKVVGKATRDAISAIVTGAAGIKNALDGPLTVGANTASVRVTDMAVEPIVVGGVDYLAARFDCEVIT